MTIRGQCRIFVLAGFAAALAGCGNQAPEPAAQGRVLRLAATTICVQSGLLGVLLPVFEARHGMRVEVAASGSGKALDAAREGQADVVLVHSRKLEDQFVADGCGLNRRDVMDNDYVILGPFEDPAGVCERFDAVSVMAKIASEAAPFVSRGDNSGTHIRELDLWSLAEIEPAGEWYVSVEDGMLETLREASMRQAYVLSDRATYLFNEDDLDLVVSFEGDERLFNPYGVIAVNPAKFDGINYEGAMAFIEFITSPSGQELIAGHGRLQFGRPLFHPMAGRR